MSMPAFWWSLTKSGLANSIDNGTFVRSHKSSFIFFFV